MLFVFVVYSVTYSNMEIDWRLLLSLLRLALSRDRLAVLQAVKVAHERGCSVAIFAPAWTREGLAEDDADNKERASAIEMGECLSTLERFLLRDRALWDSIWPFLKTKLPSQLPFRTSFCLGQGKKRRLYGEVRCRRLGRDAAER